MSYAIGIDLGGTNIKAVCVQPDGKLLQQHSYATEYETEGDPKWAIRIREIVDRIQQQQGGATRWIGLGSPGLAKPDETAIAWMTGRLEQVVGLNWTQYLGRDRLVPVLNDAHAALLGEVWQGAAAGARDAVLLTLGTGVGGAILLDGKLLKGHIGRAGHLGHISLDPDGPPDICNTPGSLEHEMGNYRIKERTGGRFTSTKQLVRAYEAGDAEAAHLWLKSVKALAASIASIINAVDPQFVILGGGVAAAGDALFKPLAQFLDRCEWRPLGDAVRIVPAKLGEFAGALGAAYNAIAKDSET